MLSTSEKHLNYKGHIFSITNGKMRGYIIEVVVHYVTEDELFKLRSSMSLGFLVAISANIRMGSSVPLHILSLILPISF